MCLRLGALLLEKMCIIRLMPAMLHLSASVHSIHQHPSVMLLVLGHSIVHFISHVIVQNVTRIPSSYCSACPLESRIERYKCQHYRRSITSALHFHCTLPLYGHFSILTTLLPFHARIVHAHVLCVWWPTITIILY